MGYVFLVYGISGNLGWVVVLVFLIGIVEVVGNWCFVYFGMVLVVLVVMGLLFW